MPTGTAIIQSLRKTRVTLAATALSLLAAACLTHAQGAATPPAAKPRAGYIGDTACAACHRNESPAYQRTAHHLTSQPASKEAILGSFLPGGNILTISDPKTSPQLPALFFKMEAKGDTFQQTAITGWGGRLLTQTATIDIVTGSGKRGQTYLSWQGDRLVELPVSYWSDGRRWINSPGYADGTANFSRPVNPGCLECHATFIRPLSADPATNRYERASLVTGIACETCHGPGAAHAAKYANSAATHEADTAILNPAKFPRDRQVDACAVCHSGIQREALAPAFSFVPGKPLGDYFKPLSAPVAEQSSDTQSDNAHPDVHGNQAGLLMRSRCYRSSPRMSCSTCHNPHEPEKTAASYSPRCLSCHQWTSCGEAKKLGHAITGNCIDCHMPVETTKVIASETAGEVVRAKMRNHWIKVYPNPQ